MNLDTLADNVRDFFQTSFKVDWISTTLTVLVILLVTAAVSFLITRFIRRILEGSKGPLPSSTIFVNIARVVVWGIGLSVILSSCFNVNVGALMTALGVGGIALSLGFQDTLSNLIGGLQMSLSGLIKPGDHIQVNTQKGIVHDVTWRHTVIVNSSNERVIIPNSVINSTALMKLRPLNVIIIPIHVTSIPPTGGLEEVAEAMQAAATQALTLFDMKKPPIVHFTQSTTESFQGTITFQIADSRKASAAQDVVLRAIAPLIHADYIQPNSKALSKKTVTSTIALEEKAEAATKVALTKAKEEKAEAKATTQQTTASTPKSALKQLEYDVEKTKIEHKKRRAIRQQNLTHARHTGK